MPVSDEVQIKMSGQAADALLAWREMKKGPEEYEKAMEKMGRGGKRSADTLGGALESFAKRWISIGSVISIAQRSLDAFMQSNKRAMQEGKAATLTVDESIRKIMVQANMRQLGISQAQLTNTINQAAIKSATSTPFASSMATQAISSGFDAKDILQGGGLDSLLGFANATNARDQDPAELVKAVGLFLGSTGQQLNSSNLKRTLVGVQRLFKGTNMQASALPFLAREGAQISSFGGLSGDDALSIGSVLLNTLGEQKAATAFRGTISDMALLGKDPTKVKALGQLGLKTTDVDMVGESFVTALERINTAANKLDPSVRNIVLGRMFKEESMPGVLALMSDQGRAQIAKNRALMGDEAGYMADVLTATTGQAAESRRNEARQQAAMNARGFGDTALAIGTARTQSIESGDAPIVTDIKESIATQAAGIGFRGQSAVSATDFGLGMAGGFLGMGPSSGKVSVNVTLRDEDNRTIPTEPVGKGIETMGE